jgi:hypothetical protein
MTRAAPIRVRGDLGTFGGRRNEQHTGMVALDEARRYRLIGAEPLRRTP